MSLKSHTPTPWTVRIDDTGGEFSGWPSIDAPEELDTTVIHRAGFKQEYWGDLSLRETLANVALIVRAVNSHAALVGALGDMLAAFGNCGSPLQQAAADKARAALAKATSERGHER